MITNESSLFSPASQTFRKGLLAVDIDGTLLTDHGHITDEVHRALTRVHDAGWEVVLASGRTYHAASGVARELPFVRYTAVSNGTVIVDTETESVVHMNMLTSEIVGNVIDICRKNGVIPVLYNSDQFKQRVRYDTLDDACEFFEWYVTNDPRCEMVGRVEDYTGDVLQMGSVAAKDRVFEAKKALSSAPVTVMTLPFESEAFGGKNQDFWFIQIVPEGSTKTSALKRIQSMLAIPNGRTVAVGDNYNDIEMLAFADVGVAMGNAPDEIKASADLVVASNNESGLSELVDRVILSGQYFPDPD